MAVPDRIGVQLNELQRLLKELHHKVDELSIVVGMDGISNGINHALSARKDETTKVSLILTNGLVCGVPIRLECIHCLRFASRQERTVYGQKIRSERTLQV
jgi:hypothetical protein